MNPILTIGGVMPGTPEMTHWRSGMNHPTSSRIAASRGPSISMAGVMPGAPTMSHWQTAYPNGESIYVVALRRAEAEALRAAQVVELPQRASGSRRRAIRGGPAKAA